MGVLDGALRKWVNYVVGWEFRWFVLDTELGILSYYLSREHLREGKKKDSIYMKDAKIGIDDEDECQFFIITSKKRFYLQARDFDEREKWVMSLEDAIRKQTLPSLEVKPATEVDQFTTKVQEADAYLQMLIEQSKDLDRRMRELTDPDAIVSLRVVKTTLDELIENVKQSLLHLLMARHSSVVTEAKEIAGLKNYDFMSTGDEGHQTGGTSSSSERVLQISDPSSSSCAEPSGASAVSNEEYRTNGQVGLLKVSPSGKTDGSQEEEEFVDNESEDDFFDAESSSPSKDMSEVGLGRSAIGRHTCEGGDEGSAGECHSTHHCHSSRVSDIASQENASVLGHRRSASQPIPPVLITDDKTQYDELYDDYDDEQLESLDQHGSLIRHLLAQVRIGMDLTKVVLPTFILERRSLLEMFADFFAHPDVFVDVADKTTPQERLVQIVRWYLSAFHAGRRNQVAKKPYNPILGETFRCYWSLPNKSSSSSASSKSEKEIPELASGPVPWARQNCLTFAAEQVSHHPPISAFYSEHAAKRISLEGYIWTKSKFLGLSIGVYMVGQATVCLLDLDEQYVITFPTGYGRSILTVPWIELGGTVNIACAKTGYSAAIEFLTKPFYGGRKHQITANLFDPLNPRKAFMHIEGAWNGVMYAIQPDGSKEVFVDTYTMPIVKKTVRPIDEQEEMESRRLWAGVTLNLKRHNVTKATEFKHSLEQKQREDANYRKEHGIPWSTNYFEEIDGHWLYRKSLLNRTRTGGKSLSDSSQGTSSGSFDRVLSST